MTVTELLRAACDEFRIGVPEEERTVKCLVDRLNKYLLKAHAEGRRAVLMIDEAQNLRPKVLEQVRLLTNLETTKNKLLQIFLVGQPELRAILQREGLRQLNQRITARYHLRPFDAGETAEYVRHRLAVAGVERQLFTRSALRRVHRLSGGVPRLINILCDRALLGACVTRSSLVTKAIVDKGAREVKGPVWAQDAAGLTKGGMVAAALVLAVGVGWMGRALLTQIPSPTSAAPYVPPFFAHWLPRREIGTLAEASVESESTEAPAEGQESQVPSVALAKLEDENAAPNFAIGDTTMDRAAAMKVLLRRWGLQLNDLGQGDPCERVMNYGLRCEFDRGGWSGMRFLDRPALIKLEVEDGSNGFAAVGALDTDLVTLDLIEGAERVPVAALDEYWDGEYLLLWQPPPFGTSVIGPGSSGEPVRWLRKLLSQVPDLAVKATDSGIFDRTLADTVRRFQELEGLDIDGVAGPKTLIRLHNAVAMPEIPRLGPVP
jgi:general secretion pathway protein A